MPTKISEYCAKKIFDENWPILHLSDDCSNFLKEHKSIIKVDQFVKRRGKKGLLKTNITSVEQVNNFISSLPNYSNFILEKQVSIKDEKYFCIIFENGKKKYIFHNQGGINCNPYDGGFIGFNINELPIDNTMLPVLQKLDNMFDATYSTMLEVNPLVFDGSRWLPVDFAMEVDSCSLPFWQSSYLEHYKKGLFESSASNPTENKINELDKQSGASLKFKILNPSGNILTLIAGGGASVLFTDAIVNRGYAQHLFNYGEYSGNPSKDEVYQYCSLIFHEWFNNNSHNRHLIIGGGISNFTDVAATFKGIILAIQQFAEQFKENSVKVFVRRGGVNEEVGLLEMRRALDELGISVVVKGTETPITDIIVDALPKIGGIENEKKDFEVEEVETREVRLWNDKVIFAGNAVAIIQRIIDYDYYIGKKETDVVGVFDLFCKKDKLQKFFWGSKQISIPLTSNLETIQKILGEKTATVYNYNSIRSCEQITHKLAELENIKTFYIIAEGLPERTSIKLQQYLENKGKTLLGPSSVGGIKSGQNGSRIGSVGGLIENIERCKLATEGNVAVITKSGGLLNEMLNYITNLGLNIGEAISIGGDRYAGLRFIDLLKYYEQNEKIKLIVILGETGGTGEIDAAHWWSKNGKTPVIGWCSGTSEKSFADSVEFGHAGATANSEKEEANNKNYLMAKLGFLVPETFEQITEIFKPFVDSLQVPRTNGRQVPTDISTAIKQGIVRVKPQFTTEVADERTDLKYRKEPIEKVVARNFSLGYTIGKLWLNVDLDDWAAEFLEKALTIMAEHGPAVSGAQNTIITARAGKNLVDSLVAGLLTIGPRFGGAVADAAKDFYLSWENGESAEQFVERKKKSGQYIMGIGHRVKSKFNPDKRVEVIKEIVSNFPEKDIFTTALEVEKATLAKKSNLILNVDGAIGAALMDIIKYYNKDIIPNVLEGDLLNGLFVVARSIGFIAHYNEQKLQNNGLFRANPWDVDYM